MRGFTRRRRSVGSVIALATTAAMCGISPAAAGVQPLKTVVKPAIASGRLHTCALSSGGTVVCWGANSHGELGNNSIVESLVPVKVHGVGNHGLLSNVTAITAGNGISCALLGTKNVDCWGYGGDGQLGRHSNARSLVPVQVHGVGNHGLLGNVTAISAGDGYVCALLATRNVVCWGGNTNGELGNNSTNRSLVPTDVHGVGDQGLLGNVTKIATGSSDTPCALLVAKTVVCWGDSTNGELGNNSTARSLVPVPVHGIGDVGVLHAVGISGAGQDSSCAVLAGGGAACWGYTGSLGIGTNQSTALTPVQVHGIGDAGVLSGVTAISDHSDTPCALRGGGTVACWSDRGGEKLGTGDLNASVFSPVQVRSVDGAGFLSGATAITGGELSSCALLTSRAVVCWGADGNGELGNNSITTSALPVQVHGVGNVGFLGL